MCLFSPGLVETNFGNNATGVYTHVESPLRQSAQEVAEIIGTYCSEYHHISSHLFIFQAK